MGNVYISATLAFSTSSLAARFFSGDDRNRNLSIEDQMLYNKICLNTRYFLELNYLVQLFELRLSKERLGEVVQIERFCMSVSPELFP